jgi:hypothetical protein
MWKDIANICAQYQSNHYAAIWIPSHLDKPERAAIKAKFIAEGGEEAWIQGNIQADILAGEGAAADAPPVHFGAHCPGYDGAHMG